MISGSILICEGKGCDVVFREWRRWGDGINLPRRIQRTPRSTNGELCSAWPIQPRPVSNASLQLQRGNGSTRCPSLFLIISYLIIIAAMFTTSVLVSSSISLELCPVGSGILFPTQACTSCLIFLTPNCLCQMLVVSVPLSQAQLRLSTRMESPAAHTSSP